MTEKKLIELTHLEAIRLISGIFQAEVEEMQERLVLCNLISRNAMGMSDDKFTDETLEKIGVKLKRGQ